MVQIDDGKGRGNKTAVNDDSKMQVKAQTVSDEHYHNHEKLTAYHVVFAVSGLLPGAAFLYMKNSDDKDMVVEGFRLYTQCDAKVKVVKDPTVGTITADTNTPANVNLGAGLAADGTFNTARSGAISGVTGGTIIDRVHYCSGCGDKHINFECDVIVPKNKEIVWFNDCCSGCNIAGTVPIYFTED